MSSPVRYAPGGSVSPVFRESSVCWRATGWYCVLHCPWCPCCPLTPQNELLRKRIDGDNIRAEGLRARLEANLSTTTQALNKDKDGVRRAHERELEQLRERAEQHHRAYTHSVRWASACGHRDDLSRCMHVVFFSSTRTKTFRSCCARKVTTSKRRTTASTHSSMSSR